MLLNFLSNAIVKESNVLSKQLLQFTGDRCKRTFLHLLSVGTAQMRHQDDGLGAVVDSILDGGQGADDALVVGDGSVVKGDVEINLFATNQWMKRV